MGKVKIIKYEAKYKKELAKMFEKFHNHMVDFDSSRMVKPFTKQEQAVLYVDKMIKDSKDMNGFIYLAIIDSKPIGFAQGVIFDHLNDEIYKLISKPGSQGWIGELYVDSNYRKQGIGKALFEKAKSYFETKNCVSVNLKVFDGNKDAIDLYARLGMEIRKHEMDLKL